MKIKYMLLALVVVIFTLAISAPNFVGSLQEPAKETTSQVSTNNNPRGGSAVEQKLSYSDLQRELSQNPSAIKKLVFLKEGNGVQTAVVEKADGSKARVELPGEAGTQVLLDAAGKGNVAVEVQKREPTFWESYGGLIIMIGIFALFFWWMRRGGPQGGMVNQVTRIPQGQKSKEVVTFKDVAGAEEAKQELMEIVSYLSNPGRLKRLGGKAPSGVLLIGDPGNGKTLLAKAVAGEAGAEFHEISGSAFVEMFVGVGARRVRDFFQKGREKRPAVIFIDEIDAVGRQRGTGVGGGNDEREQTLNQILVEMDGFNDNEGIIFMAATNRPDILDPALTRPGRFGLHILVDAPDKHGRIGILKVHSRNKKLAEGIELDVIAANTPGFSGAQLAELMNESARVANRRIDREIEKLVAGGMSKSEAAAKVPEKITMEDLDEAADRVQMGPAKEGRAKRMSRLDMLNTAVHELGHAWVSQDAFEREMGGDPVTKITIVPRARALGYTMAMPSSDRYGMTDSMLKARIRMALGGRVAQEVFLNTVDTGASNDFKQVWNIATKMVTELGMSKLGPICIGDGGGNPFLGRQLANNHQVGPALSDKIDEEVRRIIDECYHEVVAMLKRDAECFMKVVDVLMEKETILGPEFVKLRNETVCAVPLKTLPASVAAVVEAPAPTVVSADAAAAATDKGAVVAPESGQGK
ncbi:MAG TPA: AAA family ATPase [Candidatus Obscuribacter sp.]|nr:AAA family ATPase [Candidatus Obscuribacter sp.]HNB14376.1 AAA family ATPase [Candidatus Obscuribacter sp.]HND65741.1 AAA family ATPase [Candidatus Obscuribacter sp.]